MENLPLVVLRKLFELMPSLNERVKCSHVCRNWRAAFETTMKPESLALYFQEFLPNHRLFYSNERVPEDNFLRMPRLYDYLHQFLNSEASALFVNIKKLVVIRCYEIHNYPKVPALRLQKQLNRFKRLEHLEIVCNMPALEGAEIDLPNLKVLSFWAVHPFDGDDLPIVLNTPRLQALRICNVVGPAEKQTTTAGFKFLFPESLNFIEMTNTGEYFQFETEFVNLQCLAFHYVSLWSESRLIERWFGDDFLKSLPSLKVLYFDGRHKSLDLPALEAQRRKFGMNNLAIVREEVASLNAFDYSNWPRYVQHKQLLKCWPNEFFQLIFHKLINCRMPLEPFKEGYFRIRELKVRQVPDQTLLVDFLRKTQFWRLILEHDCNLGQSFFDQIAESAMSVPFLSFQRYDWSRLSDPSVFSRLNMYRFGFGFHQFSQTIITAVLKNPACFLYDFSKFDESRAEDELPEHPEDGEPEPEPFGDFGHYGAWRVGSDFFCRTCLWFSAKDPNRLEDPIGVAVRHFEKKRPESNLITKDFKSILTAEEILNRRYLNQNAFNLDP